MISKQDLIQEIEHSKEYFERSSRVLTEADSGFVPVEGMMTVSQLVGHIAHTNHWFLQGATSPEGFDLNFEKHCEALKGVKSLIEARKLVDASYAAVIDAVSRMSEAELSKPMAPGPVMGGQPRYQAFLGVVEHAAHHRGALTVYTRLLNKQPLMPYMEM